MRRLFILLVMCGLILPCLAGNGIGARIGNRADSVFVFYPSRLAKFPFYSVFEQYTLCGKAGTFEKNAGVEINAAAMIFSEEDTIFLIQSPLTVEQFQKKAGGLGASGAQEIKIESSTGFRFSGGSSYGVGSNQALILFTGKGEFLFGEEKKVTRYLSGGTGNNENIKKCFALLRPDAAAYGVLTSSKAGRNGFLQSGNAGTVAFSLCRMEGMPSPVVAEVLFFPSSPSRLTALYREVKEYIENVYRTASLKGPISAEMRHAFTVSMSYGFVRLDMALTDSNGRDFFRILLSQWKN